MKLTKKECKRAIDAINDYILNDDCLTLCGPCNVLEDLINEHFELLDKYEKLERENGGLKTTIKNLREKENKRYEQY